MTTTGKTGGTPMDRFREWLGCAGARWPANGAGEDGECPLSSMVARDLLRTCMRDLSEELLCAGWTTDMEHYVWREAVVRQQPICLAGPNRATAQETTLVALLIDLAGGIWCWDDAQGREVFVELAAFLERHEEWVKRSGQWKSMRPAVRLLSCSESYKGRPLVGTCEMGGLSGVWTFNMVGMTRGDRRIYQADCPGEGMWRHFTDDQVVVPLGWQWRAPILAGEYLVCWPWEPVELARRMRLEQREAGNGWHDAHWFLGDEDVPAPDGAMFKEVRR